MTAPIPPAPRPTEEILRGIEAFSRLRVTVVGDLFLDEYIEGEMFEISREGPIPVLRLESRRTAACAAGNLASSVRNLGAAVRIAALIGDDPNGRTLLEEFSAKGIDTAGILVERGMRTLTYTKIRARVAKAPSREILRLDVLPEGALDPELETRVIALVEKAAAGSGGIVVLDQIHHLVTRRLLASLPALARRHGALLHGSSREHIVDFEGFDLIVPNDTEAAGAVDPGGDRRLSVTELGEEIRRRWGHRQVLLTLGPEGMALFPHGRPAARIPSFARDVVDVTGAGDAVAAAAILGNLSGWDLGTVAWVASHAAAIALAHAGTHHVSRAELAETIRKSG